LFTICSPERGLVLRNFPWEAAFVEWITRRNERHVAAHAVLDKQVGVVQGYLHLVKGRLLQVGRKAHEGNGGNRAVEGLVRKGLEDDVHRIPGLEFQGLDLVHGAPHHKLFQGPDFIQDILVGRRELGARDQLGTDGKDVAVDPGLLVKIFGKGSVADLDPVFRGGVFRFCSIWVFRS
jgi:hypothetical protein